jgi:hypothetical protein
MEKKVKIFYYIHLAVTCRTNSQEVKLTENTQPQETVHLEKVTAREPEAVLHKL